MGFSDFVKHINEYIRRSGISPEVSYFNDREKGFYTAKFPNDGITITGNSSTRKLTVRFGSGHLSQVRV